MKNILFVCSGNTCRSPMAEGLFRDLLVKRQISHIVCQSAGVSAFPGDPAAENAVAVLREWGIDISGHRSRPVSAPLLEEADLILCMTKTHGDFLREWAGEKVNVLGNGIPDPYGGSLYAYRACRDLIRQALEEVPESFEPVE